MVLVSILDMCFDLNLADVKSMVNNGTAQRYEKAHNIKRVFICNEKRFKIPVYVDSEAVTARVHDLPPSTLHASISEFMTQFGYVILIHSER